MELVFTKFWIFGNTVTTQYQTSLVLYFKWFISSLNKFYIRERGVLPNNIKIEQCGNTSHFTCVAAMRISCEQAQYAL